MCDENGAQAALARPLDHFGNASVAAHHHSAARDVFDGVDRADPRFAQLGDHLGIMAEGQIISEHDLLSLDGSLVKVQLALPDGVELAGVDVLHESAEGRLRTLIVRGNADQVRTALSALNPVLLEIIPLSLEELFLYELNEVSPHVKNIVL